MKTMYLICNAHLDPVWLWDWEEGAAAAISTFRSAVDLAEEFDYIFCHNEVILYRWIEEYDPALFAEIQELAKQGKWYAMGGWYLQPDCNMPTGESMIRQMMTGRRYFEEKLGQHPTTAVNVDPFGHSAGLPQVLRGCGYDSYLICRPGAAESDIPDDFLWEGVDGSVVRVCRAADHYNSPMGEAAAKLRQAMERQKDNDYGILLWGVGNHGGGPSRKDLSDIAEMMKQCQTQILHATPEAYMATPADNLPIIKGSNRCMPGCYTSMARIKQRHRQLESKLYQAEKMCVAAAIQTGMQYPMEELAEAQRALMTSQFHDILPGSAVQAGEEMGLRLLDHGLELANRVQVRAMFAFAAKEKKANPGEYPVLVYNPHPYPVTTAVSVSFILENQNWEDTFTDLTVYDGEKPLPTQVIKEPSNLTLDWAKKVVFICTLKPMSLNRFDCKPKVIAARSELPELNGDFTFRNEFMTACINGKTGLLNWYESDGMTLVNRETVPVLYRDNADPWGMNIAQLQGPLAAAEEPFRLMTPQEAASFVGADKPVSPIRIIEDGAVMTEVESLLCCRRSAVRINWRFYRHSADVDVTLNLLFLEKNAMVKWHIPVAFSGETHGQIIFGQEELPQNGTERVAQDWVSRSDETRILAVLRKGSYGLDCTEGELRFSLVRGVAYAAHPIQDRPLLRSDRYIPRIDQGEHTFCFRLIGGKRQEITNKLARCAQIFNEEPVCLQAFPTGKEENKPESLLTLEGDQVVMTALKNSEDDGYILRLFNSLPRNAVCKCNIRHLDVTEEISFRPFEVRTFRITQQGLEACHEMAI